MKKILVTLCVILLMLMSQRNLMVAQTESVRTVIIDGIIYTDNGSQTQKYRFPVSPDETWNDEAGKFNVK